MTSDFIDALEHELRAASQRRVRLAVARLPRPVHAATSGLRTVPVLLAALVAIAIAVVALTEVRHNTPSRSTGSAVVTGRQQLIDILGVLRRPQTKADLNPQLLERLERLSKPPRLALLGTPDLPLIRLAMVTPWDEKVFLVPMKPPSASAIRSVARQFPHLSGRQLAARRARGETLGVFTIDAGGGGGGSCCATAASIEAGPGPGMSEGFHPPHGSGFTRLTLVVPDDVSKVAFLMPHGSPAVVQGAAISHHGHTVTVSVRGNVAAVQFDRIGCCEQLPMIWYDADGQVIKRVRN